MLFDRTKCTISRKGYSFITIPVSRGIQKVVVLADFHLGHPECRIDLIDKAIQWILDNEAMVILGGDLIENGTKTSVGAAVYDQIMGPQEQVNAVVELLRPIERHIVAGYRGNHENRTWVASGMDPMQGICSPLGIPYFGYELFGAIVAGGGEGHTRTYLVYGNHSDSGHKNSGLAINHVQRDWNFTNADIMFKSHDHHLDYSGDATVLDMCAQQGTVRERRQHIVLTGSCLSRANTYAGKKPYRPNRLGFLPIALNMNRSDRLNGDWGVRPIFDLAEG